MKKFNFLKFSIACAMLTTPLISSAQNNMRHWDGNWYQSYVGERVLVTEPANIAGSLIHTIANEGGSDADKWGAEIPALGMIEIPVVKCDPYDACSPITNGSALAGKIALIKRGDCEFGAKAKAAADAGAVAVIIVNNVSGGPVGMGAGAVGSQVTAQPVIMISDVDGAAIESALAGNGVKITLCKWGTGKTNDIGFVDGGIAISHANSIPLHQMVSTGVADAYKIPYGAVVANFGTADQTGINVKAELKWTPDGGSETVLDTRNISLASLAVADSVATPFDGSLFTLPNVTTTGRFDLVYELTMTNPDDFTNDNKAQYSFYVTNNVISKGRYSHSEVKPNMSGFYKFADATHLAGHMFFNAKGGYKMEKVQASISNNNQDDRSLLPQVGMSVIIWKWQDKNANNLLESSTDANTNEVSIAGFGDYQFVTGDTSQQIFPIVVTQFEDKNKAIVTEDNTWYWTTVNVPGGCFVGCDGVTNYHMRSHTRFHQATPVVEPYSVYAETDYLGLMDPGATGGMFPFEGSTADVDTVRFSQQRKGVVPNIAIYTSPFLAGVNEVSTSKSIAVDLYPNPATDVLNASINLENTAANLSYTVLDATGKEISRVIHKNVKKEVYQIEVSKLNAGNYYLVINADNNKVEGKKFTIIK